tara:strand:- start:2397 stop:3209 length:813 start_codon:yes stop_codon:yes gene_type:complete
MIGLVLGDTHIGHLIIKKLKLLKKDFIIIDISKRKIFKIYKNSFCLSIGQLGKCLSILRENSCNKVLFAGRIEKPNFSKIKFDFKALYHLPKIIKETKKGDAYIINFITKLFMKEGFKIINQTYYNSELVLKKGTYTKVKPNYINKKDIKIGKKIINNLKLKGVSQGIVVVRENIIISENLKGTDFMLNKAKKKLKKYTSKNKREGILLKLPKPNQDLRTDLPTVGLKTVKKCAILGIKGIVVKSKHNIFLDRKKSLKIANKNNMFVSAI